DRIFDPLSELVVRWQPSRDRELIGIEQRQRAAGHLLGAPVRVAIELRQQPRNIQPSRLPNADRHPGQAGDEVGYEISSEREAGTWRQLADGHSTDVAGWRLHIARQAASYFEPIWPGNRDPVRSLTDVFRRDGERLALALVCGQRQLALGQCR